MMKKSIFFLIVGLISQSKLIAQASFAELENSKVIYPSPTAASLGKYGEYPVSLYNGLVNIGQDIVTVKSGHLALNVSLSYHASGNRPSDIPGWVGLGFSLNAGGVITRTIRDLPDDLTGGFYTSNTGVQDLWNNYPNSEFIEEYFSGDIDPQSDVYQFNFCGKAGEFVFDWDRNIHFKQKVPFKIEVLGGVGGFGGFQITTDDGTIYRFDQAEHSQLNPTATDHPASSWYLTKISNLSGDSIVLKYTAPMSKFRYKEYCVTRKEAYGTVSGAVVQEGPVINQPSSMDEVIYLDEIDFNNGKLVFDKSTRHDPYFVPEGIDSSYAEEKKLDLITLKNSDDSVIKQWKFEYFEDSTQRLKLKNLIVQDSDQTDVQKYSFEYDGSKLPLPPSGPTPTNPYLTSDVDYWGYWNGASNSDNRIPKMYLSEFDQYVGAANRSVNPAYAKAEMLEKITYPTGGYASFEYESNDYSAQGISSASDQNPMTESSTPPESYELNYYRDDGGFDTNPHDTVFTLTESTHVYVRYSCGADGPNHEWANPATTYEYDYNLSAGVYTLASVFNTDELLESGSDDITAAHCYITVYKMDSMVPIIAKPGPGLRIKSITTNDGISTTKRSFEYKLGYIENTDVSSGYLSVFPAFYANLQDIAANMGGFYITSDPINDIGDDAPVGYSRVVERFMDSSFIVHNYTTYDDHPDDQMPFTNGYSDSLLAHKSSNDFWRGLETSTDYYNSAGILVKKISNSYDTLAGSLTNVQAIELKPTVGIITSPGGEVNNLNATLATVYYTHSCFLYDSSQTETTYDKNGQHPISTLINKYYDNVNHLQPTRTETYGSDGSEITTVTSFPDDFASGGAPFIDSMQANHLTKFPIEQVVYKEKGGVKNIVSGNIITYKADGRGLPDQLLKLETATPLLQTGFKFSNRSTGVLPPSSSPAQYSADTHYQTVLTYAQYDNKGNLLEYIPRNGIKTSYIWGYDLVYPIAEVINADSSSIAYSSFEEDGKGKWTYSGSVTSDATSPTGKKCYNLSGGNITKSGLASNTYIVSYWGKSGSATVNSSSPTKTGRSFGSWTYYEHEVTGTSITISGSVYIDEVRLYPKDGLMTTYTYAPLIGMTSQCDPNNRIIYYQYDNFNRLLLARDQDYNILKKICYNYSGQPEDCGVPFYNVQKSGNFTRNNCASGGTGSSVNYTVSASTYSSTISQAAADQLAQDDVDANGQSYANSHGTCTFYSVSKSGNFTRNNCGSGYTGSTVTYTVPANTYNSTTSQAAADALAQNDVDTNGQGYANSNGTCTANLLYVEIDYDNVHYVGSNLVADVVAYVYSDSGFSIPYTVSSLTVNYTKYDACSSNTSGSINITSASSKMIGHNVTISYMSGGDECDILYSLDAGTGYYY